jgi:hypothetical protein
MLLGKGKQRNTLVEALKLVSNVFTSSVDFLLLEGLSKADMYPGMEGKRFSFLLMHTKACSLISCLLPMKPSQENTSVSKN